jgi:hypothetical protein
MGAGGKVGSGKASPPLRRRLNTPTTTYLTSMPPRRRPPRLPGGLHRHHRRPSEISSIEFAPLPYPVTRRHAQQGRFVAAAARERVHGRRQLARPRGRTSRRIVGHDRRRLPARRSRAARTPIRRAFASIGSCRASCGASRSSRPETTFTEARADTILYSRRRGGDVGGAERSDQRQNGSGMTGVPQ